MRIGFFYGLPINRLNSGGSIHGHQLAKHLAERGHELCTWYFGKEGSPFCKHFRGRSLLHFLLEIDVLYIRVDWAMRTTRWTQLRRLRPRLPVIWEANGLPLEIRYSGRSEAQVKSIEKKLRRFGKHVDSVIGVSDQICEYFTDVIGIKQAFCVPNGGDPDLFTPSHAKRNAECSLQVVWIGGPDAKWHDFGAMISAAQILESKKANVVFKLFGDREHLPIDLPSNVKACGIVPYHELHYEIAAADVGLYLYKALVAQTSRSSEFDPASPLKVFDYMSCGLAVVTPRVGQCGEILDRWDNGLGISGGSQELADTLLFLEADRELCARLGNNGRKAVEEYYNWNRVAQETEEILLETIKRSLGSTAR